MVEGNEHIWLECHRLNRDWEPMGLMEGLRQQWMGKLLLRIGEGVKYKGLTRLG